MSMPGAAASPVADARLALRMLAVEPRLGGACLRGGWAVRDELVEASKGDFPSGTIWRRMPLNIDPERLCGGIDLVASLASSTRIFARGLLAEAEGGIIVAPMAERMPPDIAGPLAQFLDAESPTGGTALIMLDDGASEDERPPAALMERVAFHLDLAAADESTLQATPTGKPIALDTVAPLAPADLDLLASVSQAFGVNSCRALQFAGNAARAHAALAGRSTVEEDDLVTACRLVMAPRATRLPPPPQETAETAPPPPTEPGNPSNQDLEGLGERDIVLDAIAAAIPRDLLEQLTGGKAARRVKTGGGGKRGRSSARGRPLAARPGIPQGGTRLALVDSLRAAVPWQGLRRREDSDSGLILRIRKSDLRVRRFEERSLAVTIFCVDASGSAAVARLAEAKGAVERLLAQAYVSRSEVALIAFRGGGAELLLPPTRSLTRARRALSDLPGGGGTPLAAGIALAQQVGESVAARGRSPMLVFLTDGSANVAKDGEGGRTRAMEDALSAASAVARAGLDALLIDISARPKAAASEIAAAMKARCLPLPMAESGAIDRAVRAARSGPRIP